MSGSNYVQIDYDREYDQSYLVPDFDRYLQWYMDESTAARRELPCSLDLRFGSSDDEFLDVFPSPVPDSPIVIFVHGGYWQSLSSKEFSFVARGLHAHGITVVVTNYSLCPAVTISEITRQTRTAVSWVHREAHKFNGDRRRIIVAGHSAGGQQVGMLLAPGWQKEYGLPQEVLKGAISISGIFDLRPLGRCSMQRALRLTPELVQDQSPIFQLPQAGPPLLVSFGADESAEFRRQSTDYLSAYNAKGLPGRLLIQSGRNHFDAITGLADAKSQLCDAVVSLIAQREPAEARTRQAPPKPSVRPVPRGGTLPASFAQQRLWFLAQLDPTSQVYNEPIMVHMDELVNPTVLKDCLTEITRRHEAWRTIFPTVDGEPRQQIEPPRPFHLDIVDLRAAHSEKRESDIQRIAVEHARRPFALAEGPLIRALLIISGEKESRLVVTAHHIVVDGVSFFSVFLPELSGLYAAYCRNEPSPTPAPSLQYADFASWQRRWLSEEVLGPKLAYWRTQLSNLSELPLPIDYSRPPAPSGRGARAPVALSAEVTRRLRALGHGAGVSLFTTLLAAWKTLLFRYTGQADIVVGSAAAGRPCPEFEGLIGFFNNNLVLRTQLDGSLTFLALLPQVGAVLREAREHQDVPFEKLVAARGVGHESAENPLYNNTFLLMPPMPRLEATPGWSAGRFDIGVAKSDLYLELHQRPTGLVGHLEYRTELFAASTIGKMVSHFYTLIYSIVRDPTQRLSELALLSAEEQQALARFQGPTSPPLPDDEIISMEELFAARAARSPEAIALEQGELRISYAELDARTNRLARYLRQQGVGKETRVGLCIERSVDAMVGILGVLKAGGAYVPLDPGNPAERFRFIVHDVDLKLILSNRKCVEALTAHSGRTVLLDEDWPAIAEHDAAALSPIATAKHLAYVIYTSGSTGRPRGVLVERRGLYYLAKAQEKLFGLGVGSRILQFFPLSADGSVWDLTLAWPVGATLVLARQEEILPGPLLAEFLEKNNVHAITMTPSALMVTPHRALPFLHTIISAGESLPAELVTHWAPGRRFFNAFGPTETTVAATVAQCHAGEGKPALGHPFEYVSTYVLDGGLRPLPLGIQGELYVGGPGVARGYLGCPELTAARFIRSPFPQTAETPLYKTGDRVKRRPDGSLEYLGRMDRQVKLRGFRIELGEIECVLAQHPAVHQAQVVLEERPGQDSRLLAYIVLTGPEQGSRVESPDRLSTAVLSFVRTKLPAYMVPSACVVLEELPLLPNGKVDYKALSAPRGVTESTEQAAPEARVRQPSSSLQETIAAIWREVLGINEVGLDDGFFAVGGHSLALARVQAKLSERLGRPLDILTLMRLPTIRKLSNYLQKELAPEPSPAEANPADTAPAPGVERAQALAIIGMTIRAPGVSGPDKFWEVLCAGRETTSILDPEALIAHGADPARVRRPDFVAAEGVLERADYFDAALFGYSEADAACMDPQRRLFLECAYEALEHAGCDPARFPGRIGVFAGCGTPRHWMGPVMDLLNATADDHERIRAQTLNSPDFLATGVAFKLGLRGPAVTVQTACSTSLSAIHLARLSLLAGECDLVLAGGSSITSLREADRGFLGAAPGLVSADGHCRPFDADANGMVMSSGVAVVVMKRLASAIADGDTIHAIVLGSAMNNDGADKLGFTAPSENGVAAAVEQAYAVAGIDPRSIGFLEAHGTGTRLGDVTEVRALSRAFRRSTEQRGFCALGSVKGNVGHLDTAAGAASLIKATLALTHQTIPPPASFRAPNPLLDLPSTPFFVNSAPLPWPRMAVPRRAGVNAMGLGGTNVHVLLEEAPRDEAPSPGRPCQLLCLSAHSQSALSAATKRLGEHLEQYPLCTLADVAHTLAVGRTQHQYRATFVGRDVQEAQGALAATVAAAAKKKVQRDRPVVFLFPGHGAHYLRMGIEVYETEPMFRAEVDRCFDVAHEVAGLDLRSLWRGELPDGGRKIDEIPYAQTLLFTIEYALAKQLMLWGLSPAAMLGHSMGEYVAACVAGVFSIRDALALLAIRGRLVESTAPGIMLVAFAEAQLVEPHLSADVTIATYAPDSVVLTGFVDDVERVRTRLMDAGIQTSTVRASRAGHSPAMRAIRSVFRQRLAEVELRAPSIPIVSNMTGRIMTAEQATSPDAWADHLCSPVRLEESFGGILALGSPICIELGPGTSLGSSLKRHRGFEAAAADVVETMPDYRKGQESSSKALLSALGRAWELGVEVNWKAFYAQERRRRIPLPPYPFEGRRFVLEMVPRDAPELPADLDERAEAIAGDLGVRGIDDHPGLRSRLSALCASLVLDFFGRRLAGRVERGFSVDSLRDELGILPSFDQMLAALVALLEREGLASRSSAGQLHLPVLGTPRSAELLGSLVQDYPDFIGLIRIIGHCVDHYDAALTGAIEPLSVVFPDGTDALYHSYMRDNARYLHDKVYLALARELVLDVVRKRTGRTLRILEIGAGHGMLTWPTVESLRGMRVEYHFTDVGRSFLQRAEDEAARRDIPWMKSFRYDINLPPEDQGILDRYDLILGFNVLPVARDPEAALRNLHDLLTPSGSILLVIATQLSPWDDLVFGLSPGYWHAGAHARGEPSANMSYWEGLLRRCHFSQVVSTPGHGPRRAVADHGLFWAKRGSRTARTLRGELKVPGGAIPVITPANDCVGSPSVPVGTSGDLETLVTSTWMRLLGLSQLQTTASFFELGGDSLLAVQLLAELRSKTGRSIGLRQFIAQPTIEGITALMRQNAESSLAPAVVPSDKVAACQSQVATAGRAKSIVPADPAPALPNRAGEMSLEESGERSVHSFLKSFADRMNARDAIGLVDDHWVGSDSCSLIAAHRDIRVGATNVKQAYWRSYSALFDAQARFHDERIAIFAGGRAACVTALLDSNLVYAADGRRASHRNVRVSLSLEKQADGWRVVNAHYSMPVNASSGESA